MRALLASPEVAYLVVTAPGPGLQAAARQLVAQLAAASLPVEALVINRVHPLLRPADRADAGWAAVAAAAAPLGEAGVGAVLRALAGSEPQADDERLGTGELAAACPDVPITALQELPAALEGAAALAAIAPHFRPASAAPTEFSVARRHGMSISARLRRLERNARDPHLGGRARFSCQRP